MDDMQKIILNYVKNEYLEDEDEEIDVNTPLISGGIVDSFSMVSLKRFLENKYKISIPDEKATPEAFDTVNKICTLVKDFIK
ncbi:MAG: acyl carrier protein [bacterium]|jgi:acyl carrier protein|nr:acyl carrier protein [bacterium]